MTDEPFLMIFERVQYGDKPWEAFYYPGNISASRVDDMVMEKRFTDEELAVENYEQTERFDAATQGATADAHGNPIGSLSEESAHLDIILRMGDRPDHDDAGFVD